MRRLLALTVGTLAAALALATPALAHVTVSAPGATRGGSDQEITFRVPVEKNVDTVGLTVALPTATPITSVLVRPMPGWTHAEKTVRLAHPVTTDDGKITTAVSQIRWRAQPGHGLRPGEYGDFTIIAGQLPDVASLTFKALQYYRDGSVTSWIEVPAPGSNAQPEHPAPVLRLSRSLPNELSYGASALQSAPQKTSSSGDTGPIVLSVIALVLSAAALGVAVVSRARRQP